MTSKYPRTLHMPFSPGASSDDKISKTLDFFLNKEIIITEKLDGGNSCLNRFGVFARSHASSASHPSFNWLKSEQYRLFSFLNENKNIDFFGEYCFAVHSIQYDELANYFFLFGVRDNLSERWKSWSDVELFAQQMNFPTAPVLFQGSFSSEKEMKSKILEYCNSKSFFGGDREGVVMRLASSFNNNEFDKSVVKWVRKGHVQTDQHWTKKEITKQKVRK